jgi:hypothetical protein
MARRDALGMLTADERGRLEAVAVDLGHHRRRTLPVLVQGWADHVDRLVAERDLDPDDGSRWTPHDLIAALYLRDFVERGLRDLPEDLAALGRRAVDPIDAAFDGFSVPDPESLLRAWIPGDEPLGDGWWWRRAPASGPVAHDLRELRRQAR